jgi:hypothetical protein
VKRSLPSRVVRRVRHWWYGTPTAPVRMVVVAFLAVALLIAVLFWLTA